jgi:hypothetical protein
MHGLYIRAFTWFDLYRLALHKMTYLICFDTMNIMNYIVTQTLSGMWHMLDASTHYYRIEHHCRHH